MNSLRRRLFVLLLAATGLIWMCATAWIYLGSRAELEQVLDTRLQEAARMVHSLVAGGNITAATAPAALVPAGYERQLSCQIWSLDGQLVARSSGAPDGNLAEEAEGFSDRRIDGEDWRVFTIVDPAKGVRVAVGDRIGLRDRLVRDLVAGLVAPAVLVTPFLGILIWLSLGRGLRPLNVIAGDIDRRDAEDMRAIPPGEVPREVKPLLTALNALFCKVEAARRNEREITAFAAHELRTPLAGLKTQAQVALAATNPAIREGALQQILVSVDRTTRLIRQLLALSRLEALPAAQPTETANAGTVLRAVVAASPPQDGLTVDIDSALDGLVVPGDAESLHLVLGNLHENAVQHTPRPGHIRWLPLPEGVGVMIEDDGPGVPEEEIAQITRRFYRGRNRSAAGAGLGLTIAQLAATRIGAGLRFANRRDQNGLRVLIGWS